MATIDELERMCEARHGALRTLDEALGGGGECC